jgi:hypothetical protein
VAPRRGGGSIINDKLDGQDAYRSGDYLFCIHLNMGSGDSLVCHDSCSVQPGHLWGERISDLAIDRQSGTSVALLY